MNYYYYYFVVSYFIFCKFENFFVSSSDHVAMLCFQISFFFFLLHRPLLLFRSSRCCCLWCVCCRINYWINETNSCGPYIRSCQWNGREWSTQPIGHKMLQRCERWTCIRSFAMHTLHLILWSSLQENAVLCVRQRERESYLIFYQDNPTKTGKICNSRRNDGMYASSPYLNYVLGS